MSSANNHKRDKMEEEFFLRMHDAEASPAPDLWARIDHDLTVQENKQYKKRALFYRQLAAACFALFMLAGSLLLYNYNRGTQQPGNIAGGQPGLAGAKYERKAQGQGTPQVNEAPVAGIEIPSESIANAEEAAVDLPALAYQPEQAETVAAYGATRAAKHELAYNPTKYTSGRDGITAAPAATKPEEINFIPETTVLATAPAQSEKPVSEVVRAAMQQRERNNTNLPKTITEFNKQFSFASSALENLRQQKQTEALQTSLNSSNGKKQQENEQTRDNRWSMSMAYTPSYFDQNIGIPDQMMSAVSRSSFTADGPTVSTQTTQNMEAARDEYENNTDPAFSYTMEVKAGFKLGKKLKLLTGLGYSQNAARTKTSYIVRQFWFKPRTNERYELNPSTIFLPSLNNSFTTDSISVAQTDAFNVNYKYRHVSVPVALQYEGNIAKNWYWYAAGGMAANFLVESRVEATDDQVQTVNYDPGDDSPFRKVQLSGNVAMGLGKRLSETVTVALGPEVRSYLSTLLADPDKAMAPQGKPYNIGLSMGVNYNLGGAKK
ncbi:outer membrane beta-barrel protein [Pontibacter ruber]|uniref:Outer membrane beta-barrel protein n=1 Tax=Pontibacter ruber TaxID=1343895 RepID=A0ABW5CV28_9BACT|nr:outer membrane beta-barrel protein [Pontibacter ruber]